nr:uncharacterized protein LOC108981483 [Ipomoea batatas]
MNIRYFHSIARQRRHINTIHPLCNSQGDWVEGRQQLAGVAVTYFCELFTSRPRDVSSAISCIQGRVFDVQNRDLLRVVTVDEVRSALFSMYPDKSPDAQCVFVLGCSIVDNVLLAYEVVHFLHYRALNSPDKFVALKLDMSKVFDRVEWDFVGAVMLRVGFSPQWVQIMHTCYTFVDYRVLFEGEAWGPVVPSRGLRQGDPLSPYLFLLVIEGLSSWVDKDMLCDEMGVRQTALGGYYLGLPRLVFMLPKDLCEELEHLMNSYCWGCEMREGRKGIRWKG